MGRSKDLATGETRFVNTAGDTMTGNLAINNASGSQVTLHRTDTTIANDDLYGQIILSGDDADTNSSGTRGYIRGRSQGSGGGLKMEFGTAGGGVAISDPRMTINADGIVTKPNQPHFHANRLGLTTEFRNGLVNYSVMGDTASGWNSTNHQYTIPVTGVYHFGFNNIGHTGIATSDQYHSLQFVRSGTTTDIARAYNTNDAMHECTNIAITYYLQANDLVQITNYGGVVYGSYYNTFSIFLLG